jgi:endonuclease/exonuclease/phosphatase family metal-dependent hydrolase
MRIAAYNVENLFRRIKAFNDADPTAHQQLLDAHAEINRLFEKPVYDAADKDRILALLETLGVLRADQGKFVWLRRIRGKLLHRPRGGAPFVVAEGRVDWVGWVELKTEAVDELAIRHTAMVIAAAKPDILAFVEVENRPTLREFRDYILDPVQPGLFPSLMLIDGNDDRGIDVGVALAPGYRIARMVSHVDDQWQDAPLFSRDAPEYLVETPSGAQVAVLPNHFKSKFGGNDQRSRDRRRAQAEGVAGIYRRLTGEGIENVVILGDLNDTPDSDELAPLLRDTDLREVSDHPGFTEFTFNASIGGRGIGTFDTGSDGHKIDYILLSPALWERMTKGGLERQGVWTPSKRWPTFPTMEREHHAASDHHLIWADLDV